MEQIDELMNVVGENMPIPDGQIYDDKTASYGLSLKNQKKYTENHSFRRKKAYFKTFLIFICRDVEI